MENRVRGTALTIALALACVIPPAVAASVDESVREVLMKLGQGLSGSDQESVGKALAEDAVFVDCEGEQTIGRANIAKRVCGYSGKAGGVQFVLHPQTIKELSPEAAWVVGDVSRDRDGVSTPVSRFTLNIVKRNGDWQVVSATETPLRVSVAENLAEFKWLEGKWLSGQRAMTAAFLPGNAFLQLQFQDGTGGGAAAHAIIGWDAAAKNFVSWQFHPDGGFTTSTWTHRGNDWIVDSTGVSAEGDRTRALSVLVPNNADEFKWSTSRLSVDFLGGGGSGDASVWKRAK